MKRSLETSSLARKWLACGVFALLAGLSGTATGCASAPASRKLEPLDCSPGQTKECNPIDAEDLADGRTGTTDAGPMLPDVATPRGSGRDGSSPPEVSNDPVPADDCSPTELAKAGVLPARIGAPTIFNVPFDGATDRFKSGCVNAIGPERVQPIEALGGTRMRVEVDSTSGFQGAVVLYAKASCAATVDLACSTSASSSARIEFPIAAGTTYFLRFDSLVATQPPGARIVARVEVL